MEVPGGQTVRVQQRGIRYRNDGDGVSGLDATCSCCSLIKSIFKICNKNGRFKTWF
jgi:hypothetical protein